MHENLHTHTVSEIRKAKFNFKSGCCKRTRGRDVTNGTSPPPCHTKVFWPTSLPPSPTFLMSAKSTRTVEYDSEASFLQTFSAWAILRKYSEREETRKFSKQFSTEFKFCEQPHIEPEEQHT